MKKSLGKYAPLVFWVTSPNPWSQTFDTRVERGDESVAYSSLVNTDVIVPAVSYGRKVSDRFRFGFNAEMHHAVTEVSVIQTLTSINPSNRLVAQSQSNLVEAVTFSLGLSAGFQWPVTEQVVIGFLARTPQ